MTKEIKVCHVLHGIVGGGSEQVVLNYCSRMPDIKFDLIFQYDPNPLVLERFCEANINCIQIPDKVHHPFRHLIALYRCLKKGGYDVVHSHLDWYMNAYVMFLAMLAGVPKRFAHHHQAYHSSNPLLKVLCAILRIPNKFFSTHWLACGNAAALNGWGKSAVNKGRVIVLPNAIDPVRFEYNSELRKRIRKQFNIPDESFLIGHIGRFFPEKNHKFIIDVFESLRSQRPNSKLMLVGNGPLQNSIRKLVEEKRLGNSVIFAGLQKDTAPFYCAMDVLLLPSVREAFPMTLVEAQYNGLQCVVSNSVPNEVSISNLVKPLPINNCAPWVEQLREMLLLDSRAETSITSDQFDIRKIYKQLEKLYLAE